MEEWLTENRARLYKKCKELKAAKLIKDVYTSDGDIYVLLMPVNKKEEPEKRLVIIDTEYEKLVKDTRKKSNSEIQNEKYFLENQKKEEKTE